MTEKNMGEKLSPFEITALINEKKGRIDVDEVGYASFVINRVFSNTMDSVLFANEMNRYSDLPKQTQFDFYYYGLPKKKRFGKWHKSQGIEEDAEVVMEYFGYSRKKAQDALTLLQPHLSAIRKELDRGGADGKKRNNRDSI